MIPEIFMETAAQIFALVVGTGLAGLIILWLGLILRWVWEGLQ
jgi:hypothetical protein